MAAGIVVSASGIAARGIWGLLGVGWGGGGGGGRKAAMVWRGGESLISEGGGFLATIIITYICASVEPRHLCLQHSTVVTPVMITATRHVTPNALPKPENKNMQDYL